jgi:Holliday junction resolvasome RuvABC endonuclease subunit
MRVLGIDSGARQQGRVVEGAARRYSLVEYGTLKASPRERFAERLLKIGAGGRELIARI